MDLFEWMGTRARREEPLRGHTSFQIGGPADLFLEPESEEELVRVLDLCKREEIPFFFLGNGSNLLVNDRGFRGAVICPCARMHELRVLGTRIEAQAGASLMRAAALARDAALQDLAWARGIPGSIGGAVVMNAGAYKGEMSQVLEKVRLLTPRGEIIEVSAGELSLSYRHSRLMESGEIVLAATFALAPGDPEEIAKKGRELLAQRAAKQPLEYPSAGSTFKRPEGNFAGKLIQEAGLSGLAVGGACVSDKHCGFVVNKGSATAEDVVGLIRLVRERVLENAGILLEPEVRYLGETKEGWGNLL